MTSIELTIFRALQRQRHDIERQWSESHQRELKEIKEMMSAQKLITSPPQQPELPHSITDLSDRYLSSGSESKDSTKQLMSSAKDDKPKKHYNAVLYATKRQQEFRAQIRAPSWLLFNNVLDICFYKAVPGWKFTMVAYRILSESSEVFRYTRFGNLDGLQRLFQERKACPIDRVQVSWASTPWTLLEVSQTCW